MYYYQQGLTNAQKKITSYKELSEITFNSALNCMSELNINVGNYYCYIKIIINTMF